MYVLRLHGVYYYIHCVRGSTVGWGSYFVYRVYINLSPAQKASGRETSGYLAKRELEREILLKTTKKSRVESLRCLGRLLGWTPVSTFLWFANYGRPKTKVKAQVSFTPFVAIFRFAAAAWG